MSNIYIQEPPSNGKILLSTTLGDIDIELWSKEAPKACRNFVQLCMEHYYDNTIFHRVEKGFIAQGGDPTGTGTGGESIYGKSFKDEFHQRLKFNRRGLVAMANAGADSNGSQFFFTLDAAPELNKRHTIFGKVAGNTLYNMIRFNDIDVDEDHRPFSPPKIMKTQVLSNPFDDIEPRKTKSTNTDKNEKNKKVKSKSKATKNYKLLSFGEEAEDDELQNDLAAKDLQIKSSHDLLNDPKLSSVPAIIGKTIISIDDCKLPTQKKKRKVPVVKEPSEDEDDGSGDEPGMKLKNPAVGKSSHGGSELTGEKNEDDIEDFMVHLAKERKQFRKKQKTDGILVRGESRQEQTLALLANFESKVNTLLSSNLDEESPEINDSWMVHKLQFEDEAEAAKDANMKGDDWFDIYDPRNPVNRRRREPPGKETKPNTS